MEGLIVKNISDLYVVKFNNETYNCKAKGLFRKNRIVPTVGDKVIFDKEKKIITDILERKNILVRPPISNVDQALIVMSVVNPIFSKISSFFIFKSPLPSFIVKRIIHPPSLLVKGF